MLKEYPEYKETGLYWYEKIPCNWKLQKAKYLFNKESRPLKPEYETVTCFRDGEVTLRKNRRTTGFTESLQENGYQGVMPGDLVIHVMDAFAGATGVSDSEGKCTPVYNICTAKIAGINNYFYAYFLRFMAWSGYIVSLSKGIRERSTEFRFDVFGNQFLPIPPISEQNAIVKYLDFKTKQIDEFVSAKEKEIESLQELKKTLVVDAVTKGISGEELVDSGIEWLPKVPKGWAVHTLRHLLKAFSEKNHPEKQLLSVTRELGVIVRDIEDTESNHNFIPDDLSNYKMVKKGQFVINKMKAWQGSYGVSDFDGIVSPAYFIFDLNFEDKDFFHLAIRSRKYADFFARYSDGIRSGQWDLSMLDMKNIPFFIPPKEEQKKIVKYCKDKVRNINILISSIQKQITLVKELRAKIIADVVTGKIDVREAV